MNTKILIASLIIAFIIGVFSFLIDLYNFFPAPLAIFAAALTGGCLSSYWVSRTSTSENSSGKQKQAKLLNKGSKETGQVKWFNPSKGFGFITRDNGEDIFVHFRSILGKGHRILHEGQRVEFAVSEGNKGLQAEEVSAIK